MKTLKQIRYKLSDTRAKKNQAFKAEDDLTYRAYCKAEELLIWVLDGDVSIKPREVKEKRNK